MKLYRYLPKEELDNLTSGNIDKIGHFYSVEDYKRVNNHKYKKGVKYLHFYFAEKEISRINHFSFHQADSYYVCEFEIPFYVIFPHIGIGIYDGRGYDNPLDLVYEVALPTEKMKTKYLRNYKLDTRKSSIVADLVLGNFKPIEFDKSLYEPMYFDEHNKDEEKQMQPLALTAFEVVQADIEEKEL